MVRPSTLEKLDARLAQVRAGLCIGLDPDPERLPPGLGSGVEAIVAFNRAIIAATRSRAAAYKPNLAFYEVWGAAGWQALQATLAAIPAEIPVILDAKRGDIGNTARMYARALFEELGGDAVTVSPYMGPDSLQPFVAYADRLTFVLTATSNPGAAFLQDRQDAAGVPLYLRVAELARELDGQPGAVGLVVGATRPEVVPAIRARVPGQWLLVPGIGAQGGDLAALAPILGERVLFNVSREVLYASSGTDFAEAAEAAARRLQDAIFSVRC
ncbi:MAG: orotidine-5'-phosphate decarboxylase [Candidatus Sericytochromatia bacterium]|nr:orotidine-5'-phosphate decarboxylase [Candidatus Sericytochromatia bacterium]